MHLPSSADRDSSFLQPQWPRIAVAQTATNMSKSKHTNASNRVLRELMETARDLSAYGLVSKSDMARMNSLCAPMKEMAADAGATRPTGSRRKRETPASSEVPHAKTGPVLDGE